MKVSVLEQQVFKLIDLFIKSNYADYSWNKKGNFYVFENQKGESIVEYEEHYEGKKNFLYINESFYEILKQFIPFDRERLYDALAKWVEKVLDLRVGMVLPSNILRFIRI
jgi:hypothetical protein